MQSVPISSDAGISGLEPALMQIIREYFLSGLCIFICNCEKRSVCTEGNNTTVIFKFCTFIWSRHCDSIYYAGQSPILFLNTPKTLVRYSSKSEVCHSNSVSRIFCYFIVGKPLHFFRRLENSSSENGKNFNIFKSILQWEAQTQINWCRMCSHLAIDIPM